MQAGAVAVVMEQALEQVQAALAKSRTSEQRFLSVLQGLLPRNPHNPGDSR